MRWAEHCWQVIPCFDKGDAVRLKDKRQGPGLYVENTRSDSNGHPEYSLQTVDGAPYMGEKYFWEWDLIYDDAASMRPPPAQEQERTHKTESMQAVQSTRHDSEGKSLGTSDTDPMLTEVTDELASVTSLSHLKRAVRSNSRDIFESVFTDIESVQQLLDDGFDVNSYNKHDGTALHAASACGNSAVARLLLEAGADVNQWGGPFGSALQAASANGHETIVRLLLEAGADVNKRGEKYGSALQAASTIGHATIVRLLLEARANVNTSGRKYGSALQAASAIGHETIVRLLLEARANVNTRGGKYGSALQAASANGHETIVKLLCDKDADVSARGGPFGSALQAASSCGHKAIVQLLLSRDKFSVDPSASVVPSDFDIVSQEQDKHADTPNPALGGEAMEQLRNSHGRSDQATPLDDGSARMRNQPQITSPGRMPKSTPAANEISEDRIKGSGAGENSSALEKSPEDGTTYNDEWIKFSATDSDEESELSATDSLIQYQQLYLESLDILQMQVFGFGSEVLGKIEQGDGFHSLRLPTLSGSAHRSKSDSPPDELCTLLQRNLTMMSGILNGIDLLTKEHLCNSVYNIIVVDPERDHVLRVVTITVSNLELLRDLLEEAVSYSTTPSQGRFLLETINDIGAATEKILAYLGLWTSSLESRAANSHGDCIDLCKELSSMCSILFLGLISFVKSHRSDSGFTHRDLVELRIETVHQSVSMAPRRLACLDSFVRHPVWTFSIVPDTPDLPRASDERYYLSTLLGDFTDLWGPVRLAYADQMGNLVAEVQVRGGVVRRSNCPPTTPRAQEDEVSCHFYENHEVHPTSSFSTTSRLLIGASNHAKAQCKQNPFTVYDECSCQPEPFYSSSHNTFELGTKAPCWKLETRTRQISGGHNIMIVFGEGRKYDPGISLRDLIVEDLCDKNLANTSMISKPHYVDYLVVLEISRCTGHTRRTSMWEILRNRALKQFLEERLGEGVRKLLQGLFGEEERDRAERQRSKQPRPFVEVWGNLEDHEKKLMKKVTTMILGYLRSTGVQEDQLLAWDVTEGGDFNGRKITPSWRSMVKDDVGTATFAIITDRCIQYEASDWLSSPIESPTILLTEICISVDRRLKINRPRVPTPQQHYVNTPTPPRDTLSCNNINAIRNTQEQSGPDLSWLRERLRERHERRRIASNRSITNAQLVSPPHYPPSTHKPMKRQATSSSSTNGSSPSSGLASDCQPAASSVMTDDVREDLWCNVSLRFNNGSGTIEIQPPEHMVQEHPTPSRLGTIRRFDLCAGSEAEFIPAEWKAHGSSILNSFHEKRDAVEEMAKKPLLAWAKRVPWLIDQDKPVKESQATVIEHVRGGNLMDHQRVLTVHVR